MMQELHLAISTSQTAADSGLISKHRKFTVQETIERFEAAIKSKAAGGWIVFSRIDHAAAAKDAGLDMRPRTVIIFGNPRNRCLLKAYNCKAEPFVWTKKKVRQRRFKGCRITQL
jgi:hypothetical protein